MLSDLRLFSALGIRSIWCAWVRSWGRLIDRPPQSWVGQQLHQFDVYSLFPVSCCSCCVSVLLPSVSHAELSFSQLVIQVTCLSFLRPVATQVSHYLKDFFTLFWCILGLYCSPTSTAVWRFHPARTAIARALVVYSWKAPGIQDTPFTTQLPLRHASWWVR